MKFRRFNVAYNITTSYEADVLAKNKKEAISKVVEVIGDPIRIESVLELPVEVLTNQNNTSTTSSAKGMVYYYDGTKARIGDASDANFVRSKKRRKKK